MDIYQKDWDSFGSLCTVVVIASVSRPLVQWVQK